MIGSTRNEQGKKKGGASSIKLSEKAIAPHSRTLARKIPRTEEPGGLQSMGSHRVGHDWSDLAAAAAPALNRRNSLLDSPGPTHGTANYASYFWKHLTCHRDYQLCLTCETSIVGTTGRRSVSNPLLLRHFLNKQMCQCSFLAPGVRCWTHGYRSTLASLIIISPVPVNLPGLRIHLR